MKKCGIEKAASTVVLAACVVIVAYLGLISNQTFSLLVYSLQD